MDRNCIGHRDIILDLAFNIVRYSIYISVLHFFIELKYFLTKERLLIKITNIHDIASDVLPGNQIRHC